MRSEHFSTEQETIKTLTPFGSGPVLYADKSGFPYSYTKEGHTLFLGVSGTGKSRSGTIPLTQSIINNGESAIVIDPKGEIYRNIIVPDNYDIKVIDFRNICKPDTDGWNPLTAPYELYMSEDPNDRLAAEQMIGDMAYSLYNDPGKNGHYSDPFWITEARNVFIGAIYTLFKFAKPEEINITSVYSLIMNGDERFGMSTVLKELANMCMAKDNIIGEQLYSYVTTANDTKAGIRSVMLNGLSVFSQSESIRRFLSYDDMDINSMNGEKPIIVFIILPDETPIYDKLASILTVQLTNHFIRIAERDYAGKLPIRMNIVLEELASIAPSMPNLPHLMSAGRSRNLRMFLVLQSLSQMNELFGKDGAETILANCDVRITFRINNMYTLKEISSLCGIKQIKTELGTTISEPLITEAQLAAMENRQALIMIRGRIKYITWLPDFTQLNVKLPTDTKKDTIKDFKPIRADKIFDIKKYVKEAKAKSVSEQIEQMSKQNPGLFISRDNSTLDALQRDIEMKIALLEKEEQKKREKTRKNSEKSTNKGKNKLSDKEDNKTGSDT